MKTTKILGIICFVIVFSSASLAQSLHIRAGLNIATMHIKQNGDVAEDIDSRTGFQVSVLGEFGSENIKLETGLLFTQKGVKYDQELPLIGPSTFTWSINYLELPINGKYYFGGETLKGFVAAGPYVGYAISGKVKLETEDDSDSEDIDFGSDANDDDLKPLDYGVNLGAGVVYNKFQLGVTYGLGLTNLLIEPDDGDSWQNRVIQIHLSYQFLQ